MVVEFLSGGRVKSALPLKIPMGIWMKNKKFYSSPGGWVTKFSFEKFYSHDSENDDVELQRRIQQGNPDVVATTDDLM